MYYLIIGYDKLIVLAIWLISPLRKYKNKQELLF